MFQAVFTWAQLPMNLITAGFNWLGQGRWRTCLPPACSEASSKMGRSAGSAPWSCFLPQILVLFLFILLLEDFGYMARAAFLMDRIMGGAGLRGRAFIPLLSSFACAIPGIIGRPRHRQPARPAGHRPGVAAHDLLGRHPGLHAHHRRLRSEPRDQGRLSCKGW